MINPISKSLIAQAQAIPNYSPEILLADLLEEGFVPAQEVKLITYAEAAKIAKVSRRTICWWACRGVLKRYGHGKCVRLNEYELKSVKLAEQGHCNPQHMFQSTGHDRQQVS